uniref:Uncharacterized protein n=1 Tax=Anguilla anguilla TaxID=7936 RepID=A0A0E9PED6_ANGAN
MQAVDVRDDSLPGHVAEQLPSVLDLEGHTAGWFLVSPEDLQSMQM